MCEMASRGNIYSEDGTRRQTNDKEDEELTQSNVINVKIRRLHPDAVIPQYATELAAGFDLVAVEDVIIAPGETALVPTGLAVEIPPGYEMQVRPRSGISLKTKLRVANSPGTVDADYRGEVGVIADNTRPDNGRIWAIYKALTPGLGDHVTDVVDLVDGSAEEIDGGSFSPGTYIIRKGDRIAQGVIVPVIRANFEVADELSETERGDGGFGSTGVADR